MFYTIRFFFCLWFNCIWR